MDTKISVVIPMYNAARVIRQCLVSILASKFADYEVLVVDDCSTDDSVAEVKKILPHFGGRLKIFSTQKNSGGAGLPRNIGLANAAGKYVTFIDNDDMILPTALTDFFTAAEKFRADVVHTEKFFAFNSAATFRREELSLQHCEPVACVDAPTLEPDDLRDKLRRYVAGKFFWLPWGKFFRRDFLIDNRIDFPRLKFSEDMVFCFKCLCLAKKYLRVPHVTNIHRMGAASVSKRVIASRDGVRLWLSVVTGGIRSIDDFTDKLEFFRRNPDLRHDVLKFFIDKHFDMIRNLFTTVEPYDVPKIFFDELQNPALNSQGRDIIAAYLFAEKIPTR